MFAICQHLPGMFRYLHIAAFWVLNNSVPAHCTEHIFQEPAIPVHKDDVQLHPAPSSEEPQLSRSGWHIRSSLEQVLGLLVCSIIKKQLFHVLT